MNESCRPADEKVQIVQLKKRVRNQKQEIDAYKYQNHILIQKVDSLKQSLEKNIFLIFIKTFEIFWPETKRQKLFKRMFSLLSVNS